MYNLDNKIKQQYYNFRNGKDIFRDEDGAIDLASIMVGVIVIGLIGGVIAATVFAVIPWAQDNAAKQQLDSIVQAENAYFGLSAANPSSLPTGYKTNSFGKSAELANAKLLITGTRYCATTPDDSKSYTGYSQSSSGTIFTVTDKNTKPETLVVPSGTKAVDALPADCKFITEGIDEKVSGPYVDPTPSLTTLTYKCNTNTTVISPYNGSLTGKETWSDLTTSTTHNRATQTTRALTAGVTYQVTFDGTYTKFTATAGSKACLRSVDHWGENSGVTDASNTFLGTSNLIAVPDHIPSTITNMTNMFNGATSFNDDSVKDWDVSNVTNMSGMFNGASTFNQDLSGWDVSNVTNMSYMFNRASSFNQDLSKWDTSNVSDLTFMFNKASAFNQDLSDWDTGSVKAMAFVFGQPYGTDHGLNWATEDTTISFTVTCTGTGSISFLSPIGSSKANVTMTWNDETSRTINNSSITIGYVTGGANLRNVTGGTTYHFTTEGTLQNGALNWSSSGMAGCLQGVDYWSDGMGFTNMTTAFMNTPNLTSVPPSLMSGVTDLTNAFKGNTNFNDSDVSNWDVSNVTNMSNMFYGASAFNQPLNSWNTSKVTNMSGMFNKASAFNQDISSWDTSNVTTMTFMFNEATAFNQDLSDWDTGSVKAMAFVFGQPYGTSHGLNWATENTTISFTVKCAGTGSISFLSPIGSSKANTIMTWSDESSKTHSNSSITIGYVYGGWNIRNVTGGTTYRFTTEGTLENASLNWGDSSMAGCLQSVDYWSKGMGFTNMNNAFMNATNLTSVPSSLMSGVTNLSSAFKGATSFNDSDVSNWDVSNVTNMSNMFYGASAFNQNLSSWNTNKVNNMSGMFNGASAFNQDISSWNISNVTDLTFMFNNASVFNQDLSSWDTGKVKAMAFVFGQPYGTSHGLNWATENTTISFTMKCAGTGSVTLYSPIGSNSANATMTWSDGGARTFTGSSISVGYSYGGWNLRSITGGTTYRFTTEGTLGANASLNWGGSSMTGCLQSVDYWSNGMGFTNMNNAFMNTPNLTSVPSSLMSGVTNLSSAFKGATSFNDANVRNWDVSKVTNMSSMFAGATNFNQDLSGWNTAAVTNGTLFAPTSFPDAYMPTKTTK